MGFVCSTLLVPLAVACGEARPPVSATATSAEVQRPATTTATTATTATVQAQVPIAADAVQARKDATAVAKASVDHGEPRAIAYPAFTYTLNRVVTVGASAPPAFRKVEEKKNAITDTDVWLQRNSLALPTWDVANENLHIEGNVPPEFPAQYKKDILVKAIKHPDHAVLIYGPNYAAGRLVAVVDGKHEPIAFFDFTAHLIPPKRVEKDMSVEGQVQWAVMRDNVLYVSTGHRTYASATFGKNAFISAIDVATGALLWQSDPLVSNADNFLLMGDHIVSGYGFTAEPDALFVLSRATGKTVKKIPLKSGPDWILERDGKLFVRTYNTDYVFAIDTTPPPHK